MFGLHITAPQLFGQLLVGLINGSFYALLSLGLAVIFGMLNIVNFAHGAFYMLGAFAAYFLLNLAGLNYWWALILAPLAVGAIGALVHRSVIDPVRLVLYPLSIAALAYFAVTTTLFQPVSAWIEAHVGLAAATPGGGIEWAIGAILLVLAVVIGHFLIERIAKTQIEDHLYGLLLTFGLALVIQGLFQNAYGSSGLPYPIPRQLQGAQNLGFMFLPNYRAWVIGFSVVVCFGTWFAIEKTSLGAYLRAATENPTMVRAFGINVPRMITLTYAFGVGLAALAGVLAAPINQVRPAMGADIISVVFAVVVIGGMGSILGSILTGFALGLAEGLTKVFYSEASNVVVFVIMAIVLLVKPTGLFGRAA